MARKKKEAPAPPPDRIGRLLASQLVAKLSKDHGDLLLVRASDERVTQMRRISSGIFPLDVAIGGGWPAGRVHVIFGKKSTAKTTIVLSTIAAAQKCCANCWTPYVENKCECRTYREPLCAYVDVEGTFDKAWAVARGVDLDKMLLSKPSSAELALDMADALVRSKEVDILALDSIAFLTPEKEKKEDVSDMTPAMQARLVNKAVRKFVSGLNEMELATGRRPTIFLTNQIRMKVGVIFGSPETQSGGMAPGFAATVELKTKGGKYTMDTDLGQPMYVELNFEVTKNKAWVPHISDNYRIVLSDMLSKKKGDIYDEHRMLALAKKIDLLENAGGKGWKVFGEVWGTQMQVEARLVQAPEFKARVWKSLMELRLAMT